MGPAGRRTGGGAGSWEVEGAPRAGGCGQGGNAASPRRRGRWTRLHARPGAVTSSVRRPGRSGGEGRGRRCRIPAVPASVRRPGPREVGSRRPSVSRSPGLAGRLRSGPVRRLQGSSSRIVEPMRRRSSATGVESCSSSPTGRFRGDPIHRGGQVSDRDPVAGLACGPSQELPRALGVRGSLRSRGEGEHGPRGGFAEQPSREQQLGGRSARARAEPRATAARRGRRTPWTRPMPGAT